MNTVSLIIMNNKIWNKDIQYALLSSTSINLLTLIKKSTLDTLQYIIHDMFETNDPQISLAPYRKLFSKTTSTTH